MSLVALVLALPVLFATPSAEDVQHAVGQAFETGRYQDTRPTRAPVEAELGLGGGAGRGRGRGRGDGGEDGGAPPSPGSSSPSGAGAGLLELLLWTGAAILALLMLVAFVRALSDRRLRPPPLAPPTPAPADAPLPIERPLDEATALAAQGRYAEAAHVLLLQTFEVLSEEEALPTSWTSREVAAHLALDPTAAEALGRLVEVTEVSLFGGRTVDAQAYQACVQAHRALRSALTV